MERIVFPELAAKAYPSRKELSFKHILVIVYIFGGISALVALVSKTICRPLFDQLTQDRRDYSQLAARLLRHLNTKLASQVTYVPPVRDTQKGRKYVDGETQTEEDAVSKMFTVSHGRSNDDDVSMCADLNASLNSVYDNGETFQLDGMKYAVEELSSLVHSLNFSVIKSLGKTAEKEKTSAKDYMSDLKKEIRSIKGSLLSARNFPTVTP
jgi:hypothetical protein